MVNLGGGTVSYERGTPVESQEAAGHLGYIRTPLLEGRSVGVFGVFEVRFFTIKKQLAGGFGALLDGKDTDSGHLPRVSS